MMATVFHSLAHQAANRAQANPPTINLDHFLHENRWHSFHAVEAVVLSVAALEAGINEITFVHANELATEEFLEMNLQTKWLWLPRVLTGNTFSKSVRPWQDFETLIQLRNEVVHCKVALNKAGRPVPSSAPKCVRNLEARKLTLPKDRAWMSAVFTNATADWAVDTVADMFTAIANILRLAEGEVFSFRYFKKTKRTEKR
jgi:hypothetical protein